MAELMPASVSSIPDIDRVQYVLHAHRKDGTVLYFDVTDLIAMQLENATVDSRSAAQLEQTLRDVLFMLKHSTTPCFRVVDTAINAIERGLDAS